MFGRTAFSAFSIFDILIAAGTYWSSFSYFYYNRGVFEFIYTAVLVSLGGLTSISNWLVSTLCLYLGSSSLSGYFSKLTLPTTLFSTYSKFGSITAS